MEEKLILDACCGGRMFWFNKNHPNALYIDNRIAEKGHIELQKNHEVMPDVVMDFRDLKYQDSTFQLVVFDPPHMKRVSKNLLLSKKYGVLEKETWKEDLTKGFNECWRVLKENGILIFKWNECEIKVGDVLKLFSEQPLFGHPTSKAKTHWLCFMKIKKQ